MNKRCCFIILLLACKVVNGQDTIKLNQLIFKIAPVSFFDEFSFRSAQAGFEFRFTPKYSVDFSYGQIFGREFYNHSKGTGFKAKSEFRRYTKNKRWKKLNRYLALEGFYHKIDYPASSIFKNRLDSTTYGEDYFIKKNVWGLNVKYGFAFKFLKRFAVDVYGGLGIRVKDVQHYGRTHPEDDLYSIDILAVNIRDSEGNYALPNLTVGFKIGYVLKQHTYVNTAKQKLKKAPELY